MADSTHAHRIPPYVAPASVAQAYVARFPTRFYAFHLALLAVSAVVLLWVFHATRIDLVLEAPYYDAPNDTFPLRYWWFTKYFMHRYVKYALIVSGLCTLLVGLATLRKRDGFFATHRRRWWFVVASFAMVPITIGILRRYGPMHCPWDVTQFGGYAPYLDLWSALTAYPEGLRMGRCVPAAYVGSGSWVMAFALLWWPERRKLSIALGVVLFASSLAYGWVQQFRGAHFLSHTLWSLWVTWAVIVAMHAATGAWREGRAPAQ